jgi:hypothetical protein
MAHIVLTLAEWRAVAHELQASHHVMAPAGLNERLRSSRRPRVTGWTSRTP